MEDRVRRWIICTLVLLVVALAGACDRHPSERVPEVTRGTVPASSPTSPSEVHPGGAVPQRSTAPTSPTEANRPVRISSISGPAKGEGPFAHSAYPHCGLDYAFDFDGSLWDLVDSPSQGGPLLHDPHDDGVIGVLDEETIVFISQDGHELRLTRRHEPKHVGALCR
jgi:hypothetical protein